MDISYEKTKIGRDACFHLKNEDAKRIGSIFRFVQQSGEYNKLFAENEFDIDWLKEKLSEEEFGRLECGILEYASRNDENVFAMGFRYAWSLFYECMKDM